MDQLRSTRHASATIFTSIFHEPWWLDAVTGGNWEEARVVSNGTVVARLPYLVKRIMGVSGIGMPPLTHTLGPQLPLSDDGATFRPSDHRGLLAELMAQLPRHDFFFQVCDPGMTEALPLYTLGYDSALIYTLRIAAGQSLDETWKGMRSKIRQNIRGADRRFSIDHAVGFDEFSDFFTTHLKANHRLWWTKAYERRSNLIRRRLYEACRLRDAGCLLGARDDKGGLRAVSMPVWGHGVMFHLMAAHDAAPAGAGSVKLLLWEALKIASQKRLTFDFDSFWRPDAVSILTGFGGQVHNRIVVSRMSPLVQFARSLKIRERIRL